jgi:hypothetical protein
VEFVGLPFIRSIIYITDEFNVRSISFERIEVAPTKRYRVYDH